MAIEYVKTVPDECVCVDGEMVMSADCPAPASAPFDHQVVAIALAATSTKVARSAWTTRREWKNSFETTSAEA
jgi:hypothetical protein